MATGNGAENALTTIFTPPAACATQFMMLAIDQYRVWMNPITPASGLTATSCYASQWLESSSVAAFDPLVCPSGYQTQSTFSNPAGYIACCPSGFDGLALDTDAPASRPAASATCYTNIYNSGILVTQYGSSTATATTVYTATDPSAQAYAHAYDGFKAAAAGAASTTSSGTASSSNPSGAATSSTASGSKSDSSISGGAIAGGVIGAIAGVAIIVGLVAFLVFRRRKRRAQPAPVEMPADSVVGGGGDGSGQNEKYAKVGPAAPGQLAEMPAPVSELPGSEPTTTTNEHTER